MDIELATLRSAAIAVFDHLERRGIAVVSVDGPLYWNIETAKRYAMDSSPSELDVGSIYDDYADLTRIASGAQMPLATHLQPLGTVLEAVGVLLAPALASTGG